MQIHPNRISLVEHTRDGRNCWVLRLSVGYCRTRITIRIVLNEIWCAHKITIIHSRSTRWISLKHNKYFLSAAISMRNRYHRIPSYRVSQWRCSLARTIFKSLILNFAFISSNSTNIYQSSMAWPIESEWSLNVNSMLEKWNCQRQLENGSDYSPTVLILAARPAKSLEVGSTNLLEHQVFVHEADTQTHKQNSVKHNRMHTIVHSLVHSADNIHKSLGMHKSQTSGSYYRRFVIIENL